MAQVAQCRQAHRGQGCFIAFPRGGDAGEIAVGEGQRHDIRRLLTQVDRLDQIIKRGGYRGQDVHGASLAETVPNS